MQAQVMQFVPAVDTGPHAAHASTAAPDPFAPDPGKLAALTAAKAQLAIAIAIRVPGLAVQVSPQLFGEVPAVGHLEPALPVHDVLSQLTYEAGLVVQLLEEARSAASRCSPRCASASCCAAGGEARVSAADHATLTETALCTSQHTPRHADASRANTMTQCGN